jgi:hypothetical protein
MKKTIVILAKSLKHNGYCVAGKDVISKQWIRAVSDENGSALSREQCKCTNNNWQRQNKSPYHSSIFKKVEINFLKHAPLINHQPENYVISNEIWQHKFNIEPEELKNYLDDPESLWGDGDRISYSLIKNNELLIHQSLYLVEVHELNLYVNEFNKRRASFIYKKIRYDLSVTDINFDDILKNNIQNEKDILCVSLGENYEDFCYKIIATIF